MEIKEHLDIHAINLKDYERTFEIAPSKALVDKTENNFDSPTLETMLDKSIDYQDIPEYLDFPDSPSLFFLNKSFNIFIISSLESGKKTPLPAASPSALITIF